MFDGLRVPVANALGNAGDAARMLTLTWNGNRPLVGLAAVHLAQRALDAAREYAGVRVQFGTPIGGHQLIQKNLADIEMAVTTSRLLCYYALDASTATSAPTARRRWPSATPPPPASRRSRWRCTSTARWASAPSSGSEQLYRDARMLPIPDATNEILTLIQGRELTGIEAFRA